MSKVNMCRDNVKDFQTKTVPLYYGDITRIYSKFCKFKLRQNNITILSPYPSHVLLGSLISFYMCKTQEKM